MALQNQNQLSKYKAQHYRTSHASKEQAADEGKSYVLGKNFNRGPRGGQSFMPF